MPPRKPIPAKAEMFPEDAWYNAMEAILLKIEDLKKHNKDIQGKLENVSERRMEHNVEHGNLMNRIRDVGLGLAKDELKKMLRSLRTHERWSDHYRTKYEKLEMYARRNVDAMEVLYKQLWQTPYPGEEPLVESAEDAVG